MMKLLRAGYRRYFRNILFWIALVASAILGVASGYPLEETEYTAPYRNLHKGKSVVVLKKTAPVAKLTAKAKGFKPTTIDI